ARGHASGTHLPGAARIYSRRWHRAQSAAAELLDGDPPPYLVPGICADTGPLFVLHGRALVEAIYRVDQAGVTVGPGRRCVFGIGYFNGWLLGVRDVEFRRLLELGPGRKWHLRALAGACGVCPHDDLL